MQQITVLIIDEHPEVSVSLAHGLSSVAGFRVVSHTTNPVWAAEFAHYWKPQIIIADFKHGPRRSELVRGMKERSLDSQVVVFSSYYTEGERDSFLEAGASRCLLKGLTLNELSGELQNVAIASPTNAEASTA